MVPVRLGCDGQAGSGTTESMLLEEWHEAVGALSRHAGATDR